MLLKQTCRHYWLIEPPSGPVSLGICRFCLETRDFKNSSSWSGWGRWKGPFSGNTKTTEKRGATFY